MRKLDKISHFLPLTFANGNTINRFAKHCVHCNELVDASAMHGVITLIQDRAVLAARAHCPHCHRTFALGCVITHHKHVHRILLPSWLLLLWLRFSNPPPLPPSKTEDWNYEESTDAPTPIITAPSHTTASSETLGRYQERNIPLWIEIDGQQYHFVRPAPNGMQEKLGQNEILFDHFLVYLRAPR